MDCEKHPSTEKRYRDLVSAILADEAREKGGPVKAKQLRDWFYQYNGSYFRSELKRPAIVIEELGEGNLGYCDTRKRRIVISPRTVNYPEMARRTLLHEMAHLVSRGHNAKYIAVLEVFQENGEEWAGKMIDLYRGNWIVKEEFGQVLHPRDLILDVLDQIMIGAAGKKLDFRTVKRSIADSLDMDVKDVDEYCPWLREDYNKMKRIYC